MISIWDDPPLRHWPTSPASKYYVLIREDFHFHLCPEKLTVIWPASIDFIRQIGMHLYFKTGDKQSIFFFLAVEHRWIGNSNGFRVQTQCHATLVLFPSQFAATCLFLWEIFFVVFLLYRINCFFKTNNNDNIIWKKFFAWMPVTSESAERSFLLYLHLDFALEHLAWSWGRVSTAAIHSTRENFLPPLTVKSSWKNFQNSFNIIRRDQVIECVHKFASKTSLSFSLNSLLFSALLLDIRNSILQSDEGLQPGGQLATAYFCPGLQE